VWVCVWGSGFRSGVLVVGWSVFFFLFFVLGLFLYFGGYFVDVLFLFVYVFLGFFFCF